MSIQPTSIEAWDSVQGEPTQKVRERILAMIGAAADYGRTDDEMEAETGLRHQTLSATRRGLAKRGEVVDSGKRRNTRSGRKAIVWVIPEEQGDGYPWPF